jgi:ABC-2 type transport system ATP-binding protein
MEKPMTDNHLAIQTRALSKRYGRTMALEPLDLELPRGSALALLGRNGAGKSTLLRILMNLVSPTSGEARVFGKSPGSLSEAERAWIGYIADGQDLPEWMTVGQYIAFLRPFYPTWDETFCQKLVKLFDLPMERRIRHLSRGQRVKAAFVGGLAFHPKLLLLDEPFGGLDPAVRDEVLDALFELMTREEWTILVSSHEIDEVERLADLVVILDGGKAALRDEKDALLARCRSVSLHTSTSLTPSALPAHWWNPHAGENRVTFVDTQHDAERFRADLSRLFPDAQHLSIEPAPLKTITRALLRHNLD